MPAVGSLMVVVFDVGVMQSGRSPKALFKLFVVVEANHKLV